jgi:hypothetical protein
LLAGVENHMPEVVVIDEIGTELEAAAARTIAERGVQLVGTAHGRTLDNLLANPTLADLVGGVQAVTLGDEEARRRGTQKTVLERKQPPTFDVLVEQQNWRQVIVHHDVAQAVDDLLRGHAPEAELRERDEQDRVTVRRIVVQPENVVSAQAGDLFGDFDRDARREREFTRSDLRPLRALRDPRREPEPEPLYNEEDDLELDVEVEEPTGTTGAPSRPGLGTSSLRRRTLRIYPFGVSRERLEQSAKQLRVPVEISRDPRDADAVIALKTLYRRQPEQLRAAESVRKPIYVLRTNTVAQMQECLARIFELRDTEAALASGEPSNPVMRVMQQTEDAIHSMLNGNRREVELAPQNASLRRMQHQIANRYNLESRSRGREPNRRVQIFGR